MSVFDELERVLAAGTWRELAPFLQAPPYSDIGKEIRGWYRSRRAHWTKEHQWSGVPTDRGIDPSACLRALAVALARPEQAANRLWKLVWGWQDGPADELLVQLAAIRGRDWCVAFLETASAAKASKDDGLSSSWIARLARPLIAAGLAGLPTGPAFPKSWAAYHATSASRAKWALYQHQRPERYRSAPDPVPGETLVDQLRADPVLADALSDALAGSGVIGILERYAAPSWELGPAVADLVGEGRLDRSRVVTDALAALTRQDTASTQKGIAKLLVSLELRGSDVAERIPLVHGLLATGRGSVTAALLPAAIEATGAHDLPDLAAMIFARPEKAQRTLLLRSLTGAHAVERWGRDAVITALRAATEVPDQAFASRATKALTELGMAPVEVENVPLTELWVAPPPVAEAGPAAVIELNVRGMTAALSRIVTATTAADAAVFWDAIVRWFAKSPRDVRSWAQSAYDSLGEGVRPPTALWAVLNQTEVTAETHRQLCDKVGSYHADGIRRPRVNNADWSVSSLSLTGAIREVFASETTLRLGTIPYLLSTPTQRNGMLRFDALLERIEGYGTAAAGPTDLFLALLRLEPTPPERATELQGLSLDLWSPGHKGGWLFTRSARRAGNAIELVRRWIDRGGLPGLATRHEGATVAIDPVQLPVDIGAVPGIPAGLLAGHRSGTHDEYYEWGITGETGLGIAPAWPDLLAAKTQLQFDQSARFPPRWLPLMAHAPAPGLAVHHDLAATLCHADEDHRLIAVESALTLMGRGLWDASAYTDCCLHMLTDGVLRLGRLGHSWEQLILAGGLQPLWPTAMAVLDAASSLERKPAGLADVIGDLRRFVSAVPDPQIPKSVQALAVSKGSSKARIEAEAFVSAAQREGTA